MVPGSQQSACVGIINSPGDLRQCASTPDNQFSTLQANKNFVVKEITTSLTWKNNSTADCFFDLYWCKARRDIPIAEGQGATGQNTFIEQFFNTGLAGQGTSNTAMGVTPFQSAEFVENFKILKKTTTLVNPGGVGQTSRVLRKPQLYNTNYIGYTITQTSGAPVLTNTITKGVLKNTYFWFGIIRGTPAGASSSTNTSSTSNLQLQHMERYAIHYVVSAVSRVAQNNSAPTTTPVIQEWTNPSTTGVTVATV